MDLTRKIDIFSERLSEDPHSRVFAPLADLLRQAGRGEDALDLLDDGLGRHPDYVSALVIKGRTLLDLGRIDQAREVLARVLELDGENFVVLRLMTEDARSRQAWDESIPLLEKLVVLDPDDERWPGALAEAKQFARRDRPSVSTSSSFATMTLVEIYLAQGYRDKALEALEQMASREPDRPEIQRRITELKSAGPVAAAEKGTAASPGAGAPEEPQLRPAARRTHEKKQFADWINRIRQDGGTST
ncbi:MAG: tetratricopeptide repeat protein [Candidatus Krumholzibacteriota bacterium]